MNELEKICRDIRLRIVESTYRAGKNCAHVGGSLSAVEILAVLYHAVLREGDVPEDRDRFILSKGHGSLALYCTLESKGLLSREDVDSFEQDGSRYTAHARKDIARGIEFSGGSLGLGVSYAVGVAHALKMKGSPARVYTLLGDGECDEGMVWEALMYASHYKLDNLTVIVDHNHMQADGLVGEVMDTGSLADKFAAFGFASRVVDGHDVKALADAFGTPEPGRPNAIVAETVKGKGIPFMENKTGWHFASLSESHYKKAIDALAGNG